MESLNPLEIEQNPPGKNIFPLEISLAARCDFSPPDHNQIL